jgi:uncharacterized protein YbbK (DUF523 family)
LQDGRKEGLKDLLHREGLKSFKTLFLLAIPSTILQFCNPAMEKILISACLLGERVRYHGGDARLDHPILRRWQEEGRIVPLCPEVTGGLTTPRPAAEITATPEGRRVLTAARQDVTGAFERGAEAAADACAAHGIRIAILKDRSPSCGSRSIYDGTFSGRSIEGQGVTAARLRAAGVRIFSESEIEGAIDFLEALDSGL